ncbi:AraC family transcriptional regulator [Pseudoalteromonas shioyasakiensis]|uniref:AraC family transcriptional regulator n=1 Tax=Pseudoalteromonas shioyasakiensis TaxID=1190813 RepID=UPI0021196B18|nr:AraC family transcriptional regulator [Pseudoalteromonas shioyasakiensis]MCQ8879000.1 AraC family transcriptional regulator [Pseudoalteromonas shioyasakiensis]
MYFVSSQIIRSLVQFLVAQGLDAHTINSLLSSRAEHLDDSRYKYPVADYEQLMAYAAKQLHCDHVGLKFGQSLKTQSWGLLGHIALVSDSLGKVLEHALQLNTLIRNVGIIQLNHEQETSHLSWSPSTEIQHYMVDELFSSWLAFAKYCSSKNTDLSLLKVQFTRAEPHSESLRAYKAIFNCPIEFQATTNTLSFKRNMLSNPLNSANQELEQLLSTQAMALISEDDRINQLKALITAHFPDVPNVEQAAIQLGLKKRSLQRYLTEQGCSYSQLIDEIRKYHAKRMLLQKVSVLEISNRLGFSEQSALQRAFKRWYGYSPKKFLAQIKN